MKGALDILRNQIERETYADLVDFLQFTGKPAIFKESVIPGGKTTAVAEEKSVTSSAWSWILNIFK